jgi:hypothetical protein
MFRTYKRLILGIALLPVVMAIAQTQAQREALSIQGYEGQAAVIRYHGHVFVDAQDLAQITDGSLRFERRQIVLTIGDVSDPAKDDDVAKAGFSRPFIKAAIEAMASIREWGGMLMVTVQDGYPVGNTMAGNTITAFQGRADDTVALASAAASTDSDRRGVELLRNEFNNVQAWSEKFVEARRSLSAANITMSENALSDDTDAQKIIHCGQFLAQMFAGGKFQDDAVCH